MPRFWCVSVLAVAAAVQGPGSRVTYRARVFDGSGAAARVLAAGEVSGPGETRLRLALRSDTAVVEALFRAMPRFCP